MYIYESISGCLDFGKNQLISFLKNIEKNSKTAIMKIFQNSYFFSFRKHLYYDKLMVDDRTFSRILCLISIKVPHYTIPFKIFSRDGDEMFCWIVCIKWISFWLHECRNSSAVKVPCRLVNRTTWVLPGAFVHIYWTKFLKILHVFFIQNCTFFCLFDFYTYYTSCYIHVS